MDNIDVLRLSILFWEATGKMYPGSLSGHNSYPHAYIIKPIIL